jgi:DNA-binding LytR/AlgR family response regulator
VYGYELDVFRYILKPDFNKKAPGVLDDALLRLGCNKQEAIWIRTWGKAQKIYIDDIAYIESRRNKLDIVLKKKATHGQYSKLDKMARQLEGHGFIRCHQSYLVNSRYIRCMDKTTLELDNGGNIPVSRDMYKSAFDTLSLFVGEGL